MRVTTSRCDIHAECVVVSLLAASVELLVTMHLRHNVALNLAEDLAARVRDANV